MSNILGFAVARRTSRANLILGWLAGGELRVYSGLRPATADTAITNQILLVTFSIPNPAGTVTDGVFTGNAIAAAMVAADGNAAWGRVVDSSSGTIFDADVGLQNSGNFIEIDSLNLVQGGYCTVLSFGITET